MIELIKAFRRDENTVCVMYFHKENKQDFIVEWNNIHPSIGEVVDYDLQINCLSNSEILNSTVESAIREGSEGDDLYVAIRDTFNSQDCEHVE